MGLIALSTEKVPVLVHKAFVYPDQIRGSPMFCQAKRLYDGYC